MLSRPKIAIPLPTSFDAEYNAKSWPEYASAVEQSGGEAIKVALKLSAREMVELADDCDGILLPGSGADVSPCKYGQEVSEACADSDAAREDVDESLIREAHAAYKPLLGICFGLQSLNVWRGGTLVQDLTQMPVNHVAGKAVAVAHTASVSAGTLLSGLMTEGEAPRDGEFYRLPVNSSHHQAIGIPGQGLRVVARCPQDGVIEAIEGVQSHPGRIDFIVGVQWHPERSYAISQASRSLFDRFIAEARAWKREKVKLRQAVPQ